MSRHNETPPRMSGRSFGRRLGGAALFLCLPGLGCATAPPRQNTGESERIIAELRAKNAGDARRIEELENQIFVLEDQLDSRRLASEQRAPATLPAPTAAVSGTERKSKASVPPVAVAAAPVSPDEPSSLLAERDVEYAGAAAAHNGHAAAAPRPVLRLGAAPEPVEARVSASVPVGSLRPYRQALETLRAGDPRAALEGFRQFLDGNPRHDYADNAQYWIGECYYDLHDYRAAEPEFRKVIERYPDGNKVPDAMLKLGFTLLAEQQEAAGRDVLESLTRAYPKHEAARLAAYRLAHPDAPDPVTDFPSSAARHVGDPVLGTIVPRPPGAQRP